MDGGKDRAHIGLFMRVGDWFICDEEGIHWYDIDWSIDSRAAHIDQ